MRRAITFCRPLVMTIVAIAASPAGIESQTTPRAPTTSARHEGQAATSRGSVPNVVLILADDLGYGDLGSYGHPTIRTPRLDRLAQEGIRLTSYYAGAPACTPARAALLTGRYAARMGLAEVVMPEDTHGLPASELTLAEALESRGYQTKMVGKWHLGHATRDLLPTAHGFDSWFGLPYSNDMIPPWVQTTHPLRLYRDECPLDEAVEPSTLTERYTDEAVRFIQGAREPFFLYVAHNMPHLPIGATKPFKGRSRAGLYGDVIETIDWSTAQMLDALDERMAAGRTVVVFVSDNGPWSNAPPRMLQGGVQPWHTGSTGPLRGAKGTTWEGGVRVPAIIRWPDQIRAGRASAEPADATDLYVTLLEAAGAAVPPDRPVDGRSLMPLLRDGAPLAPRKLYFFREAALEAIREGPWKLRVEEGGAPELYNLDEDPGERFDRAAQEPALVARLVRDLRAFAASVEH
ncbi:MAG: sulfatase family protein [Vicinamibacteraceae bacterium]